MVTQPEVGLSDFHRTRSYIDITTDVVRWSLSHGLSGDWGRASRKLDALSDRLRREEGARGRVHAPDWAYRLEGRHWIDVLGETLLPESLTDLVETLTADSDGGDLWVWRPLDREAAAATTKLLHERRSRAEVAVLASFAQYRRRPAYARVIEALRAIQELHEAELAMDPIWDADVMRIQARRLGEAVSEVFPPSVRLFLALVVESRFRSELEGAPVEELEPAQFFWHHKVPGLGLWYPAWQAVRLAGDEWDGIWFIPEVQSAYEEFRTSRGLDHPEEADHQVQMPPSVPGTREEPERKGVDGSGIDSKLGITEESHSLDEPSIGPIEAEQQFRPGSGRFVRGGGSEPEGPSAEQQLREWCEVRGITPKHLTDECRARMLTAFRAGRTTETDENRHVGLR